MDILRGVDWKGGIWGSIAAVLAGLVGFVAVNLIITANGAPTSRPTSAVGTRDPAKPGGPGNALILADEEAGLVVPDDMSTRGRVRFFLVAAYLRNGDFQKAIAVADETDPGADRDHVLRSIADSIVEPELTTNSVLLPSSQAERKQLIRRLGQLVHLADKATGHDLRARLLVRSAVVKRSLDERTPGAVSSEDAGLDPETLLTRVTNIARAVPPDHTEARMGMGLTILFTALLSILGFAVSQMIQPVLQAAGCIMARDVSRFLHEALPDVLMRMHDETMREDSTPSAADSAQRWVDVTAEQRTVREQVKL
jgi:hypothetical protein